MRSKHSWYPGTGKCSYRRLPGPGICGGDLGPGCTDGETDLPQPLEDGGYGWVEWLRILQDPVSGSGPISERSSLLLSR